MKLHEFTLFVQLPDKRQDPRTHIDTLRSSGCDEGATICYGILGHLFFEYQREAKTMRDAKNHAWHRLQSVIPGVTLVDLDH